jgi:cytochrome c peroxidase
MKKVNWTVGKRCLALGAIAAAVMAAVFRVEVANALTLDEEPIKPLPPVGPIDERKKELGAKLFREAKLSKNNDVSCASCHDFVNAGGADKRPKSVGTGGALGPANSPTVLNSRFNFAQLWSGGASSLSDQVDKVIKNPKVFDTTWPEIVAKLNRDPLYAKAFADAYGGAADATNVNDALVTFERSLVTPSPFDAYLRGDSKAISAKAQQGYANFKSYGCVACHQGVNVGGNMYQKFGVLKDYFADRGNLTPADAGRFNVTRDEADRGMFKVPSLRNVALTAPYFHDASAPTLEAAVDVMFKYQIGRSASPDDKAAIVEFLKALSADPAQLREIDRLGR